MVVKPLKVSQEVWNKIDPPRAEAVILLAGKIALRGLSPDEAVLAAIIKEEWDRLMLEPHAISALHALSEPFHETFGDAQPRSPELTAAIIALLDTVKHEANAICSGNDPVRLALKRGAWAHTAGICAVCGEDILDNAARAPLPLHQACLTDMTNIGSIFRKTALMLSENTTEEHGR